MKHLQAQSPCSYDLILHATSAVCLRVCVSACNLLLMLLPLLRLYVCKKLPLLLPLDGLQNMPLVDDHMCRMLHAHINTHMRSGRLPPAPPQPYLNALGKESAQQLKPPEQRDKEWGSNRCV